MSLYRIPGATFKKGAYQVHSPRDSRYSGGPFTTMDEWTSFCHEFISNCIDAGIESISITDHHDFEFAKLLREHVQRDSDIADLLTVWPGIELTLGVPCQAILILDSHIPDSSLDQVYTVLGIHPPEPLPHPGRPHEIERLPISNLNDLAQKLCDVPALKGRFIIWPNVSESGSSSLMREGFKHHYVSMHCVGGYTDGSAITFKPGHAQKLNGKDVNYGKKAIAVIQTNDSRINSADSLGQHPTWIKWSVPTAEALRQACLASASRISLEPPGSPVIWISQVAVTSSTYLGTIALDFNPQFSSLIGGRGTGKSTILEYISWCLCREPSVDSISHTGRNIVENTLRPHEGTVAVDVYIDGIKHTVRRESAGSFVALRIGEGDFERSTPEEIRELVPIQTFRQRQLSTISIEATEVISFLYSRVEKEVALLKQQLSDNLIKLAHEFGRLFQLRQCQAELATNRKQLESNATRLEQVRKSLKGLSEAERALLASAPALQEEESFLVGLRSSMELTFSDLREVYTSLQNWPSVSEDEVKSMLHADEVSILIQEQKALIAKVLGHLQDGGKQILKSLKKGGSYHSREDSLLSDIGVLKEKIVSLQMRSKESETQVKQIALLEADSKIQLNKKRSIELKLDSLADAKANFEKAFSARKSLALQHGKLMSDAADHSSSASSGRLKVSVALGAKMSLFIDALKDVVKGTGIRTTKFDSLANNLDSETNGIIIWERAVIDLAQILFGKSSGEPASRDNLLILGKLLNQQEVDKLSDHLGFEHFNKVFSEIPSEDVTLEYKTDSGDYIPFSSASAGQQASVLLSSLLGTSNCPLLIDQPEDDLDSAFVQSLVEKLWSCKQQRQLIFASHNANLVVNGDAELVICLDTQATAAGSLAKVSAIGAIDEETVRNTITSVMEGGEKAFNLRKSKYGF